MVRTSPLVTALVRFCWPFHQQLTCWRLFLLIISISSFFGWKKNKCSAVFQVAQRKTMTRSVTSVVLQRILMKINVWKNAWHQRRWKRIKIVSVWCCLFLQCDRPMVYQSNVTLPAYFGYVQTALKDLLTFLSLIPHNPTTVLTLSNNVT